MNLYRYVSNDPLNRIDVTGFADYIWVVSNGDSNFANAVQSAINDLKGTDAGTSLLNEVMAQPDAFTVEFAPGKSAFDPNTGIIGIDHRGSADSLFGIMVADQQGNSACRPSPFRRRLAHELGHAAGHHDPYGFYENDPNNDNVAIENGIAEAWGLPMRIDYGLPCQCN